MKSKHFKKLRKKLKLKEYIVWESFGIYGDFDGNNSYNITSEKYNIITSSYERAIIIHQRRNKNKNYYTDMNYLESVKKFASFAVICVDDNITKFYA